MKKITAAGLAVGLLAATVSGCTAQEEGAPVPAASGVADVLEVGEGASDAIAGDAKLAALSPSMPDFYGGNWLEFEGAEADCIEIEEGLAQSVMYATGGVFDVYRVAGTSLSEESILEWAGDVLTVRISKPVDVSLEPLSSLSESVGEEVLGLELTQDDRKWQGAALTSGEHTFYVLQHGYLYGDDPTMDLDPGWFDGMKLVPIADFLADAGLGEAPFSFTFGSWIGLSDPELANRYVSAWSELEGVYSYWADGDLRVEVARDRYSSAATVVDSDESISELLGRRHVQRDDEELRLDSLERDEALTQRLGYPAYVAEGVLVDDSGDEPLVSVVVLAPDGPLEVIFTTWDSEGLAAEAERIEEIIASMELVTA